MWQVSFDVWLSYQLSFGVDVCLVLDFLVDSFLFVIQIALWVITCQAIVFVMFLIFVGSEVVIF